MVKVGFGMIRIGLKEIGISIFDYRNEVVVDFRICADKLMIIYDKLYISEILYWVSMRVCNGNKIELECSLYGVKINN